MIREAHKVVMTSASFLPKRLLLNTIIFHDVQIENFQVIDTLEEGITMLGDERYSTGSCVLPFLKKMEKDLEYKEDDPVFISKFKTELWSDLEKRCLENLNQRLLAKAAFFDKRFSNLKFLEEEEKKAVLDEVMAEVKVVEENSKRQQLARQDEVNENPPPQKKRRLLGAGLSDDEEEEMENAKIEMASYQAERRLKSTGCPFGWWRDRRESYPLLSR